MTAQLFYDGLDSVVSAGGTVAPNPQPAGRQGNVVKQNDDPLGRDAEISGKLQNRLAGEIHIGQWLKEVQLFAVVKALAVQTLELALVDLAAQFLCQKIDGTEAAVVACALVLLAGVSETYNQPAFAALFAPKHELEQISDGSTTVNMSDGPGKDGSNI